MATYNEIVEKVNQYLDPQECNLSSVIDYLYNHSVINSDIFVLAYNRNSDPDNFLRRRVHYDRFDPLLDEQTGFYPIDTDTFLKRMPFYFYHNDDRMGFHSFAELAFTYSRFIEVFSEKTEKQIRRVSSQDDWAPLYEMLEEMFYNFRISMYDIFTYVSRQTGSKRRFDIFAKWYKYLKLSEKLNDRSDLVPQNILYSLNKALEASGNKPVIYLPEYYDGGYKRDKGEIIVEGDFPINPETGEVEKRWIGIWAENIKYIHVVPHKMYDFSEKGDKEDSKFIHCLLKIGLLPDTLLYFADYERLNIDEMDDELKAVNKEDIHVWTPIYVGPLLLKFDFNKIKERREDYKYTQQQAAERVGAKVRTYQNWEAKTTVPDAESLIRLMNLFDINNVQDLMTTYKVVDVEFKKFLSGGNISLFLPRDEE